MPIDEDKINELVSKLSTEIGKQNAKALKIERVLVAFQSIQQRIRKVQNEDTGEVEDQKAPIIDPGTGRKITPVRRQEVYDACLADANAILGTS